MDKLRSPYPFSAGRAWLQSGIQLLRLQASRLLLIGIVLQLIAYLSQVSWLSLLFFLAIPAFTAGMLQAMHDTLQGRRPSPFVLIMPFSQTTRLGRLVLLGLVGLVCVIFSMALAGVGSVADMDPALLERLQAGDSDAVLELDPLFVQRMLFGLVTGLLIGGCITFYAAPLVWFSDYPLGRAIIQGLLGMARQWRALLVMGFLLGLISIPVAVLIFLNLLAQAGGGPAAYVMNLVMLIAIVVYQLLMFATQYTSFSAVFGWRDKRPGEGDSPPEKADQLVA